MSKHYFVMTGRDPCKECGGPMEAQFEVWPTGFSAGSGFRHTKECRTNFCPHGVRHTEDCSACDEAECEGEMS